MTDLVEEQNSGVSNNKDKVKSGDESDDEDKAICCKEGCKHKVEHERKPVTFSGCDTIFNHYLCADVL